jgi:hypothetical protein
VTTAVGPTIHARPAKVTFARIIRSTHTIAVDALVVATVRHMKMFTKHNLNTEYNISTYIILVNTVFRRMKRNLTKNLQFELNTYLPGLLPMRLHTSVFKYHYYKINN